MLDWQWINEPKVLQIFIYLHLKASNEKSTKKRKTLEAGQVIINYSEMEMELGQTKDSIRYQLTRLVKSGEISKTNIEGIHLIVTIINFGIHEKKKNTTTRLN